jgi:glycolate oxidase FAD binding subunit
MDATLEALRQRILAAAADQTPLCLRGSGSKDWYGCTPQGEVLDTRGHAGILSYEPTELVITARCGTPLAEIEAALAEHKQMLAFEPPHFGPGATVGGMMAAGLSGPRRAWSGALRDFVLGASLLDGRGELLRFGGQVMKNVAGYDVSRLLAGSLGSLGLIADVSLKVMPKPFAETTLVFAMSEAQALQQLNAWDGLALPISASAWQVGRLMLRLSGAEAAVQGARRKLGGEQVEQASDYWASLREQNHDFFRQEPEHGLWRLSVPRSAPPLKLKGRTLIEWGGAQRWLYTNDDAATVREQAAAAGGHASLFRVGSEGDKLQGVFAPLAPALFKIHSRLKSSFDPAGIFNPGRMYPSL